MQRALTTQWEKDGQLSRKIRKRVGQALPKRRNPNNQEVQMKSCSTSLEKYKLKLQRNIVTHQPGQQKFKSLTMPSVRVDVKPQEFSYIADGSVNRRKWFGFTY